LNDFLSVGGMKQSGIGRKGDNEVRQFFTEPKNICIAK
jgi:aminomuconate-semialdehyde/2-hydroxymuconate-6-semialdehyde dehydrogenase